MDKVTQGPVGSRRSRFWYCAACSLGGSYVHSFDEFCEWGGHT